jgi:hypothetical protein
MQPVATNNDDVFRDTLADDTKDDDGLSELHCYMMQRVDSLVVGSIGKPRRSRGG